MTRPKFTLRTDATEALASCPGWRARQEARRITAFMDARLASTGLSLAQFGLMSLIAANADDTIGGLAARGSFDPTTLSRNLDAMARKAWVEIVTVEKDRRRRAVWLTETGARLLAAAMPAWRAAVREWEDLQSRAALEPSI
jgi:DNA-binding MarR family transcriptional regulator